MRNRIKYKILTALIISSIFLYSCAGTPAGTSAGTDESSPDKVKTAVEQKPGTDPDYSGSENFVKTEGWSLSIPPEWSFLTSVAAEDDSQILKAVSPLGSSLSLHKIYFDFPENESALVEAVESQLGNAKNFRRLDNLDLRESGKRGILYSWQSETSKTLEGLMIEDGDGFCYEWRYQMPLEISASELGVITRIISEGELGDSGESVRKLSNGILFSSQGGPWRWMGDVGDGLMLECLVPQDSFRIVATAFHPETVDKGGSWLKELEGADWKKESHEITMRGEKLNPVLYSRDTGDNILRFSMLLHPQEEAGNLLCLFFYVRYEKDNPVSASDILNDPMIKDLLEYYLLIPREAL